MSALTTIPQSAPSAEEIERAIDILMRVSPSLDSREGIQTMIRYARPGCLVLHRYHRDLADKYGVDHSGVIFADPLPLGL